MKTVLRNRVLWYDGSSTVDDKLIVPYILDGKDISGICVEEITPEIKKYNSLMVKEKDKIKVKTDINLDFNTKWNIPDEYLALDVETYVLNAWSVEIEKRGWFYDNSVDPEGETRLERTVHELKMYKNNNLYHLLQTIIYIINTLKDNKIVWGVGRGSSVSSYVLYLIGLHDVDSVEYELDFSDFLH